VNGVDVFGLGQCSLDYLGKVAAYPAADTKCEFDDLTIQGGGPVATALVALTRWGASTTQAGGGLMVLARYTSTHGGQRLMSSIHRARVAGSSVTGDRSYTSPKRWSHPHPVRGVLGGAIETCCEPVPGTRQCSIGRSLLGRFLRPG
jgi:hypothetical protein